MRWRVNIWTSRVGPTCVVVEDSDFTHDAALIVSGDFISREEQMEYAENICRTLNNADQ